MQGKKIFQYCTCPAGRVTYNFFLSCKHMHLSCICVCNKEHKGIICNMTSSSNSSQSTRPVGRVLGKKYSSFLDFTRNYEQTSGIFVPCYGNVRTSFTYPIFQFHVDRMLCQRSVKLGLRAGFIGFIVYLFLVT